MHRRELRFADLRGIRECGGRKKKKSNAEESRADRTGRSPEVQMFYISSGGFADTFSGRDRVPTIKLNFAVLFAALLGIFNGEPQFPSYFTFFSTELLIS